MTPKGLPHFAAGTIIKGFGRGSKQLGIPTANFSEEVVNKLPESISTGIYFGWAKILGNIHKMVISIGWNPYYKNERKSMETHIMHKFDGDLYDNELKIGIVGYLRPEKNFETLEALIAAINEDIANADKLLDEEQYAKYKNDAFFK